MTTTEPDDPRLWDEDRVVLEVCKEPASTFFKVPNRGRLEQPLQDNNINGEYLLELDFDTLKSELGINSLGQRKALLKAINSLRPGPAPFTMEERVARFQDGLETPEITHSRLSLLRQSPIYSANEPRLSVEQEIAQTPSLVARQTGRSSTAVARHYEGQSELQAPRLPMSLLREGHAPTYAASLPGHMSSYEVPSPQQPPFLIPAAMSVPPFSRSLNTHDEAQAQPGKQTGPADFVVVIEKDSDQPPDFQRSFSSQKPVEPTKIDPVAQPKLRKRIAPIFVGHRKADAKFSGLNALDRDAYYGTDAQPIQDTFYGPGAESNDEVFQIVSSKRAAGYRGSIASRIKHYLRQPVFRIPNTLLSARLPYSAQQCFGLESKHLFTLHAPNGAPTVQLVDDWPSLVNLSRPTTKRKQATRDMQATKLAEYSQEVDTFSNPFAIQSAAPTDSSNLGDLAYLLEKYPAEADDEEGLPLYGDSDDDNQYDEETWEEVEAEQAERVQAPNFMTPVEVASTIDAKLQDFEHQWNEHKFPKVRAKAYQLWMRAAKMKMRQPEKDVLNRTLRRCEARLLKLKDAVISDVWHKVADVSVQCHSMEETVYTILECQHLLKVLSQDTPPPKPDKQALKHKVKPRVELPEGEEMLDSEDDIDTFIIEDSSAADDIPYAAPEDDFNPILTTPSLARRQPLNPTPVAEAASKPRTVVEESLADNTGDEADVESEMGDRVISPLGKKRRSTISLTPRKPKKEATAPIDESVRLSYSASESESDSDLDAPPKLPKTKYKSQGYTRTQVIDLTLSDPPEPVTESRNEPSSSDFDVRTPPLNPAAQTPKRESSEPPRTSQQISKVPYSAKARASVPESSPFDDEAQLPDVKDVKGMRRLDWLAIEDKSDRHRALYKGVYSIAEPDFNKLHTYMDRIQFMKSLPGQILSNGLMSLRDPEGKIREVSNRDERQVQLLTYLFMTYVCGKGIVMTNVCSEADFNQSFDSIKNASASFFKDLKQASEVYKDFLEPAEPRKRGKKRKSKEVALEEFIVDDTSSDVLAPGEEPEHSQSFKKRKRAVTESQEAKAQQKTDQQRVWEQEQRREAMESKLKSMTSDVQAQHYLNTEKPFVALDAHIAGRVKPHQVNGIRFLWREIIADPKHQGCLLAHTMGLGKTMQIISLLVTIAQCNQSDNPRIREFIPGHLRRSQTLILCPPTLLDNWYDEIVMWLPRNGSRVLGPLRKVSSSTDSDIEEWASEGGVMIMSYNLFRGMLKPTKKQLVSEATLAEREDWLLKKPQLVIADEAHQMKNAKSQLTQIAQRIETKSRIALTGSPLNNHLEEYHTMVDWIAPGYLGKMYQFKAKYVEPITLGLYAESTAYERRVCLKKLHILKQDLAPKVNRADISAISKDLPSKTEYFITLPLTALQREAYDIYIRHRIQSDSASGQTGSRGLFSLLSVLLCLCNHPSIFVKKLENRHAKDRRVIEAGYQTDASETPIADGSDAASSPEAESPEDLDAASPTSEDLSAMAEAAQVFQGVQAMGFLDDTRLSYRALLVQEILRKANARGDKTLLFSHSIDTLNYLQAMLDQVGCKYLRITGSTRMTRRQEITKSFNLRGSEYQVCLVSTRAGGLGLNFQGANRVIIYDFGFNPMWEEQAIGRAYRLGQNQPVHVYRFRIGGTVEEVINNKAVFKTQLFSRVVDKKNPTRYASNKVSDYLFQSQDVKQHDFKDCVGKDPEVLDMIIARTDTIRNIELTETFHKEDDEKLTEEELKAANAEYEEQKLQRDDPVAWQKKYGQCPKPAQVPTGRFTFGSQAPRPLQSASQSAYQTMARAAGSREAPGNGGVATGFAPGNVKKRFTDIIGSGGVEELGGFGPNASSRPQPFDRGVPGIAEITRPGAPSPSSRGISPAAQDAPAPDGASENEKTSGSYPKGCEPQ